jgi:hypothetical protein
VTPADSVHDEAPWINQYVHLIDLGLSIYLGGEELGTEPFLKPAQYFGTHALRCGDSCCDAA